MYDADLPVQIQLSTANATIQFMMDTYIMKPQVCKYDPKIETTTFSAAETDMQNHLFPTISIGCCLQYGTYRKLCCSRERQVHLTEYYAGDHSLQVNLGFGGVLSLHNKHGGCVGGQIKAIGTYIINHFSITAKNGNLSHCFWLWLKGVPHFLFCEDIIIKLCINHQSLDFMFRALISII